jgi:hypothetical protein
MKERPFKSFEDKTDEYDAQCRDILRHWYGGTQVKVLAHNLNKDMFDEIELKEELEKNYPKCPECKKHLKIWDDEFNNEYMYCNDCKLILRPMALHQEKTPKQVENLKNQWLNDGCWEIEDTDGFEDWYDELLEFRLETVKKLEQEQKKKDLKIKKLMQQKLSELGIYGMFEILIEQKMEIENLKSCICMLIDGDNRQAYQNLNKMNDDFDIIETIRGFKTNRDNV